MQQKILFGKEAREELQKGVNTVANAVCVTLGPRGRNSVIATCYPSPQGIQYYPVAVTKDGVNTARSIRITDHLSNVGAKMIQDAAEKTMAAVGDATTTTCLLMQSIVNEGMKLLDAGANPVELKKGIEDGVKQVVEQIKTMSIPLSGDIDKIRHIATVSANNDQAIGDLIAEAFEKIGSDGIITIEESKSTRTRIEVIDGFEIGEGWFNTSQWFVNNHAKETRVMEDVYILLYEKKLYKFEDLQPVLEIIKKQNKALLIIADGAEGPALAATAMNAYEGRINACIVKSPSFGEAKRQEMEDIAVLTGGVYVSDEKGVALEKVTVKQFGYAKKVIVGKDSTTIIEGKANKTALEELVTSLKDKLPEAEDKDELEKRIARLTSGVAVLHVGAFTRSEMNEKKDRCDDAIRATKAAIAEGYVPGGGTAFVRMKLDASHKHTDRNGGIKVVESALSGPLKKICENAAVGYDHVHDQISKHKNPNIGYNAKDERVEDLVHAGIIDPAKALRCSLENAASCAALILTSETLICDVP